MIRLAVLNALSLVVIMAWLTSGVVLLSLKLLRQSPPEWVRTIFHELKPFYLPAVFGWYLIDSIQEGNGIDGWRIAILCIHLFNWWSYRNIDDDDRWKRRREALAAKVRSAGHKLVVVPNV